MKIVSHPAKMNVVAYLDATEGTVEPFLADRIDSLEKAKTGSGGELEATAMLLRAGVTPKKKVLKGAAMLGLHLALPAAGYLIGGGLGLAVGGLATAGMFTIGLTRAGLGSLFSGLFHRQEFPEPDWAGRRTYEISADKTDGFDSKVLAATEGAPVADPDELSRLIANHRDPSAMNVVYVNGHGLGYMEAASMPTDQLARALDRSGQRPDVLLMESCLMSNIEALASLKGRAGVAVLSEETLSATALPLEEMLSRSASATSAAEIGKTMIEVARTVDGIETLAAIDLDKVDPLLKKLDVVGSELVSELDRGQGETLRECAKGAMKYPQGGLLFLERKMLNFSDLGGFLKAVEGRQELSRASREAAAAAGAALEDMLIDHLEQDGYQGSSGVSFQSKVLGAFDRPDGERTTYSETAMPSSWKQFIRRLWD